MKKAVINTILKSGLLAAILDILAAILLNSVILKKVTSERLLQSIASGALGKKVYEGGAVTALYGLLFHIFISVCFAAFFVLIYPRISFLRKNRMRSAIVYGIFIWAVMNLAVVPFTFSRTPVTDPLTILPALVIIICCVAIPVVYITDKFYKNTLKITC